ncbi:hypothetical protein RHSIM_Rhsim12G0080100 [Rhododendron simsii]|uniref:DUF4283 domain-containing protein n=1 Tax=Rhododendron simsii TaxID=118357 RepID=A0A834L997_RHOSS|nr:hypothetical protein RHSIM_Rhsim12G0080100 [Rhododendron simsii]
MACLSVDSSNTDDPDFIDQRGWLFPTDPVISSQLRNLWEKTLLGRFIDDRYFSEATIQQVVNSFWHTKGPVFVEKRSGVFCFHFDDLYDLECILAEQPWNVHGAVLVLQPWAPNTVLPQLEFPAMDVWVQAYNIPIECYYSDLANLLGSAAGQLLQVDWSDVRTRSLISSDSRIGHSNNACNSSLVEALDSLHQRYNESPFSSTFPLILENNKPMFSPSLRALRNTDCNRTSRIWVLYEEEVQDMEMDQNLVFTVDISDNHSSDEVFHTPEGDPSPLPVPNLQPVGEPVPPPKQGSSSWWQSAISLFSPPSPSLINPPQLTNVNNTNTPPQSTPNLFDHQLICGQTSTLHATTSNPSPPLAVTPTIPLTEGTPTTPTQPSLPFVTHTFTHSPLINESHVDLPPINIPPKISEVFRCSAPDFFGDDSLTNFDSHSLKSAQENTDLSLSNAIKQQTSLSKKRSSSSSSDADSSRGGKRSKLVQLNQMEQPPGSSGGLWVGWKSFLSLSCLTSSPNYIFTSIIDELGLSWFCGFIYGHPVLELRDNVWSSLSDLISSYPGPLFLCGDFNQVLSPRDKWGKNNLLTPGSSSFHSFLSSIGLLEIKNVRPWFTWTNNREGDACTFERLDRGWCNMSWLDMFPRAFMTNLGISRSDHAPISFVTSPPSHFFPFPSRFEAWWLKNPVARQIISFTWNMHIPGSPLFRIMSFNKIMIKVLKLWAKERIDSMPLKIKKIQSQLCNVQENLSPSNVPLEKSLRIELDSLLEQEEIFWAQRAKQHWLVLGDSNTKFFHSMTKARKARNHIWQINSSSGALLSDEISIRNEFHQHFKSFYSSASYFPLDALQSLVPYSTLSEDQLAHLNLLFQAWELSGQQVNFQKSSIFISPNSPPSLYSSISSSLHIPFSPSFGKYLGVNLDLTSKRKEIFQDIITRIDDKCQGWVSLLLNKVGRLSLLKHILTSMLVFHMSSLKFPVYVTKKISSILSNFFWSGASNKKSYHWKKWDSLFLSKSNGGLGVKDLQLFNQALLAKQSWRILDQPTCLFSSFFLSKYCHSTPFLESKAPSSCSWTWKSILYGKDALIKGIRWQVGNGDKISIWNDFWLPSHIPFALKDYLSDNVPLSSFLSLRNATVDKLLLPEKKEWNGQLVSSLFPPDIASLILSIPISQFGFEDRFIWGFAKMETSLLILLTPYS